jgi:hypothetical protein
MAGLSNKLMPITKTVGQQGMGEKAGPAEKANGGRAPKRRRCVETLDAQAFFEDEVYTQEPNSKNDLCRDARWACFAGEQRGKHHEGCCAESHERISPEPSQALAPLALKMNGCSQQQSSQKVQR